MLSASNKNTTTKAVLKADHAAMEQLLPAEASAILNLIEEPGCLLLADGRVLAANTALHSLLGLSETQLRRQNFGRWLHAADKALLQRKLLLAKTKNKVYETAVRLQVASGTYVYYQLRMQANGEFIVIIARKSTAPAAAGTLPEPSSTDQLIFDQHLRLVHCHASVLQLLGYSQDELLNTGLASLLHPKDFPAFTEQLQKLLAGHTDLLSCELQLLHKDQSYRWMQLTGSLLATNQSPLQISARLVDITPLKLKEKKLQQDQQDLGIFIDQVTHDMKGPLSSLMALHRLVQIEYGHDNRVMEYFNHYHATVERLNATVIDLLTLSQVKKAAPRIRQVNIRNMVQDCLQALCHLPDFYKITFTTRIEIKESIAIEESLLQTITQNLLENAIKYCSETSPKVLICIKEQNNQLLLEVSDNGIGIPEEAQAHIFDMFYRATTRSTGTGLGLYILKHAVDKLGGTVKVRSLSQKGSRFMVSLPFEPTLAG